MIQWHSWHRDIQFFTTDKCSKAIVSFRYLFALLSPPEDFMVCLWAHWVFSSEWSGMQLSLSAEYFTLVVSRPSTPELLLGFYFTTLLIRLPNLAELSALLYLLEFAEHDYCVLNHFFQATQWSPPVWVRYWRVIKIFALCWLWSFLSCNCLLISVHLRDEFCGLHSMHSASKYFLWLGPQTNRTACRSTAIGHMAATGSRVTNIKRLVSAMSPGRVTLNCH